MSFFHLFLYLVLALLTTAIPLTNISTTAFDPPPPMIAEPSRRRGIAYNNPDFVRYFYVQNAQVGWIYNWYSTTHDTNTPAWEYVPMLWGDREEMTANWLAGVKKAANEQYNSPTHVLSFNEPDNCE